jgi:hypothetical protein
MPVLMGGGGASASPLLTGLVSHWKLDELSGDRVDSRGGRNMSVVGTVGYQVGKLGNCATLSSGYLITAEDDTLLAIDWAAGFTITGWGYIPTVYDNRNSILAKTDGSNQDWYLTIYANNTHQMRVADSSSGGSIATDTTNLSADTWYFFAGRYNPTTKKSEISLNGGAWGVAPEALVNEPGNLRKKLAINRYAINSGAAWKDSVSLWSRYLSDEEVLEIYNGGDGLEYPF